MLAQTDSYGDYVLICDKVTYFVTTKALVAVGPLTSCLILAGHRDHRGQTPDGPLRLPCRRPHHLHQRRQGRRLHQGCADAVKQLEFKFFKYRLSDLLSLNSPYTGDI